jgi:hypothetical protein
VGRKEENQDFICIVCKKHVMRLRFGSYRNHCPFCLSSLHVDKDFPGDRKNNCYGSMKAVRMYFHTKKGWQIVHRCTLCGVEKFNKIVEHDAQPDDWNKIIEIS